MWRLIFSILFIFAPSLYADVDVATYIFDPIFTPLMFFNPNFGAIFICGRRCGDLHFRSDFHTSGVLKHMQHLSQRSVAVQYSTESHHY